MPNDINRGTTNVALPQEVSADIWAKTLEQSYIMSAARRISVPGSGLTFQTITGEPVADWVAETGAKPVSTHTFGKKSITPYKLAVIETFSNEFRRDADNLYNECARRLPYAISTKFDQTVLGTTAPGTGFDVLGGAAKVNLAQATGADGVPGTYKAFLAADAAISAADGIMDGIGLAPQGKSIVLGAVDGNGHPLFTPGAGSATVGNILGCEVDVHKSLYVAGTGGAANIVGIAGDWSDAMFGMVDGINMTISDEATLTTTGGTINLWQSNMFAVRVECEVVFAYKDIAEFVLLTDGQ